MINKTFISIILLFVLFGCSVEPSKNIVNNIILSAYSVKYDQLDASIKKIIDKKHDNNYKASYLKDDKGFRWEHKHVKYDYKKAFYIVASINKENLLKATFTYSKYKSSRITSEQLEEIIRKNKEDEKKEYGWLNKYGKYRNSWVVKTKDGDMPKNSISKFSNQEMVMAIKKLVLNVKGKNSIERVETEVVIVGPLPFEPTFLGLRFSHGYVVDGKNYDAEFILTK